MMTPNKEPIFKVTDSCGFEYGNEKFSPDEYLYVKVNGVIDVQIKKDEEGVAVDLYPVQESDEPVASTFCSYTEVGKLKKEHNLPFKAINVNGYEYGSPEYNSEAEGQKLILIIVKTLAVQLLYVTGALMEEDGIVISIFDESQIPADTDELAGTTAFVKDFIEL